MDPNELINFLDPQFVPSIKCSCPEDDLYTVDNLISIDQRKYQLGFMAYRVVKPPIELHFSLKCRIELGSIKMWTQIGSLKSTGFEVHANSSDVSREYEKIGSFFNLKENCLQFVSTALGYERDGRCTVAQFYPSTRNHLRKVKNIKIYIKQTNRSCVPVLKRIEIWGKVSSLEDMEQRKQIQQIILNKAEKESAQLINDASKEENTQAAIDESVKNQLEIPEMFLDEITYEIMALPMILPSGKLIDNSSLVKHNEQEEKWGRLPSDPFTGQIFTDSRKPILDVRLKSQIDTFLLQNCDNSAVRGVPRTVGSTKKREIAAVPSNRAHRIEEITSHSNTDVKRAKLVSSAGENASGETSSMQINPVCSNSAICNVLVTRKYTKINTKPSNSLNNCFQCQTRHEPDSNSLYIIQMCSHLICRSCLVDGNVKLCKCGKEFDNFNIKKYHITREI